MGVLSIDHVNHYPALLEARRDGSSRRQQGARKLRSAHSKRAQRAACDAVDDDHAVTARAGAAAARSFAPGDPRRRSRSGRDLPANRAGDRSSEVDVPARPRADAPAAETASCRRAFSAARTTRRAGRARRTPAETLGRRLFARLVAGDLRGIEIRAAGQLLHREPAQARPSAIRSPKNLGHRRHHADTSVVERVVAP